MSARYVERPGDKVVPPPYALTQVRLRCYWLDADHDRMTALCRSTFDEPTGGAVSVRPIGAGVALMFADIGAVSATSVHPPMTTPEREAGFWIPVRVEQAGAPARLAWFVPHLFVDEPHALIIGREASGFTKLLADAIAMPWDAGDTARVTARVRDVSTRGGQLTSRTVMEVTPAAPTEQLFGEGVLGAPGRMVVATRELFAKMTGGDLSALRMHLTNILVRHEVPLVLLRQLRALDEPTRAAHQEVVWVEQRITRMGAANVLGTRYDVHLGDADALPVAAALGLRPGRHAIAAAVEAELDFEVPAQSVLWTARVTPRPAKRTRVAILGGGIAGLATAWRLASTLGAADTLDIVVYEKDHRLGGKCASGRDAAHADRILEHGLHMWFGCYERSFRLAREVYADLPPSAGRPRDLLDAFEPQDVFEFWDQRADGSWSPWRLAFPRNELRPGDGGPLADAPALVRQMGRWLTTAIEMALVPAAARAGGASTAATLARNLLRGWTAVLGRLTRGVGGTRGLASIHRRLRALGDAWLQRDDDARRLYMTIDLGLAALRGVLADRVLARGFAAIDDEDLRAWLLRHGASARSVEAAPLRAIYDMTFAYADGDRTRPALAAGTGVNAIFHMLFAYSGSVAWKMRGSMGDVVIAPLYEALRRRGVRFELFHEVDELTPGTTTIDAIAMRRTARAQAHDPFVEIDGTRCWPELPREERLVRETERVVLMRGRDFDHVVLALPPAILETVAWPLARRDARWRAMLSAQSSVATTAAQLWFAHPRGAPVVQAAYAGPWDTWADMSHTLDVERWGRGRAPQSVFYGCGPITDADAAQAAAAGDAVLAGYLDAHAATLWPGARAREPMEDAAMRYVRFNTHGSERYVQSRPGSTALRLAPDGSGYDNLWLAGDWTRTGFDIGSVEAAVRSAELAASALVAVREDTAFDQGRRDPGSSGWVASTSRSRSIPSPATCDSGTGST